MRFVVDEGTGSGRGFDDGKGAQLVFGRGGASFGECR